MNRDSKCVSNQRNEDVAAAQAPANSMRRKLLIGAGVSGLLASGAGRTVAQMGLQQARMPGGQTQMPAMIPEGYDAAYVEHVVKPFLHESYYLTDTPAVPMIGHALSKQYALPYGLWGLLYDDWVPSYEKDGLSVFILGFDKRGPDNRRKRIYISALTADLYPKYADKIRGFFNRLLSVENTGKPLMARYLDSYFDLFWDLHLGIAPGDIPPFVRQIGHSFNAVIAFRDPMLGVVYENYMKVRELRTALKEWIDAKTNEVMNGKIKNPEGTLDQERQGRGGLQAQRHCVRMLPQLCGHEPIGKRHLQYDGEARKFRGPFR